MEIPKLLLLLCSACCCLASHESHDSHTIPVENYETELHDLGEQVIIPETPVKVIKITKTVAVKVPVPYPVKVIEKVPYPVHISKPYPVPVPQIVKVPHVESPERLPEHEAIGSNDDILHHAGGLQGNYQVQELHSQDGASNKNSYEPEVQSYNGDHSGHSQNFAPYGDDYSSEGSSGNTYEAPSQNYYGNAGASDAESFETRSYDDAIRNYLQKINSVGGAGHGLQNYNKY
ncbi:uncharacterized protein LOC142987392 [Anticarsia gemmatalis]|uniref:uncharacterized protein LOC142987392 n=1 Tax=Anticarsia gemmatalis TaxID=129554 RepID=UPI003F75A392